MKAEKTSSLPSENKELERSQRTRKPSPIFTNSKCLFKRMAESAGQGKPKSNEQTARIVYRLRQQFKLKDIFNTIGFPKSTYMYWQNRFDREDPDSRIKHALLGIREKHKNYGYRYMYEELQKYGFLVNKKKIQRIIRENDLRTQKKERNFSSPKKSNFGGSLYPSWRN